MKVASHVFAHFPRLARGGRLPIFRYCAPWKTPVTLHSPKTETTTGLTITINTITTVHEIPLTFQKVTI